MDIFDQAPQREERDRDIAIAAARKSITPLPPCGQCYNCLASLGNGHTFCDGACRDDYDIRKKAEARNGRP